MKREIKFRAWDDGVMIYSDSFQDDRNYSEWDYLRFFFEKIRGDANLMQFTGLKDKSGKEIYEGDIVKCIDHPTNTENVTNEVYFKDGAFRVKWSMVQLGEFGTAWTEVIGNIYEHPELLTNHAPKD